MDWNGRHGGHGHPPCFHSLDRLAQGSASETSNVFAVQCSLPVRDGMKVLALNVVAVKRVAWELGG